MPKHDKSGAPVVQNPPRSQTGPQTERQELVSISYEGILPPPGMLKGYNDAVNGAADRIIGMAETQARHRQSLESRVIDGNVRAQTRGQWFGFVLAVLFGAAGFTLILYDKDVMGLSMLIADIVALVTVFVLGRKKQDEERAQKREASALPRRPERPSIG